MLVKQVLGHLVVVDVHAGEVCDVVTQFLDGLHLLVQVVSLQEVTQLKEKRYRLASEPVRGSLPGLVEALQTFICALLTFGTHVRVCMF